MTNILWISGRLPHPLYSGDALYTAGMLRALAAAGARVTVLGGFRGADHDVAPFQGAGDMEWIGVAPAKRPALLSLLSGLPKDAYILAPPELRAALVPLLRRRWDWIVVDHANSAGLLPDIVKARGEARLCHVAHNVEAVVRPDVARETRSLPQRLVMRLDARKYARLERKVVAAADAVVAITAEDAAHFAATHPNVHVVPPAFLGTAFASRVIAPETPKAVLLVGSFEWIAKQRNLQEIVTSLCPKLAAAGIVLNVVGAVPAALQARLAAGRNGLHFLGQVADVDALVAQSRGGLVAEVLGGGFKLKVLDYAFKRLPIFGLDAALAGMTEGERAAMFTAATLDGLGDLIVGQIDNLDELNARQSRLYDLVATRFAVPAVAERLAAVFTAKAGPA